MRLGDVADAGRVGMFAAGGGAVVSGIGSRREAQLDERWTSRRLSLARKIDASLTAIPEGEDVDCNEVGNYLVLVSRPVHTIF
jgi:hypothetical protein